VKVAYYSPMPPERSGIADYSALLVPALAERVEELVVVKRGRRRPPRGTDVCLYHVGNDVAAHGWIVEALRARPGVVVLHEFVLHHLVAGLTLGRRDTATYLAAMEREAGLVGRLLGLGVVDGCVPPLWESRPEEFPLAGLVLDAASGLVVHSRYVEARAREAEFSGPVAVVPHPAWPAPATTPAELGPGPVIGCLGHLNPEKRIPQLLEAFGLVLQSRPDARLVLAGPVAPRFDLEARLRRHAFPDGAVIREGYVPEPRFWSLLARADVCVNLRAPTMGETSGSVLRALSLGKPMAVSDLGWFAELPDSVALKIPVDEREVDVLAASLDAVLGDDALRIGIGEAARAYAEREHGLARVAELYAAALERAAGGQAVEDRLLHEVAVAAAEVGVEPGSEEADELADRLREAGIRD
jgi:glycosyltransferase involved in cell wall biosynthesis